VRLLAGHDSSGRYRALPQADSNAKTKIHLSVLT